MGPQAQMVGSLCRRQTRLIGFNVESELVQCGNVVRNPLARPNSLNVDEGTLGVYEDLMAQEQVRRYVINEKPPPSYAHHRVMPGHNNHVFGLTSVFISTHR